MNSWDRTIEMNGNKVSDASPIEYYRDLVTGTLPVAHVSMTVGFSRDYGALKVSATVSLACDQTESRLNKAGELAFLKAEELVQDGWREVEKKIEAEAVQLNSR